MYKVLYSNSAGHEIEKLDKRIKKQVKEVIEQITQDPTAGKRLTGNLSGYWSQYSGDYRILYQIHHDEILVHVFAVGHRKNVYDKLKRKV